MDTLHIEERMIVNTHGTEEEMCWTITGFSLSIFWRWWHISSGMTRIIEKYQLHDKKTLNFTRRNTQRLIFAFCENDSLWERGSEVCWDPLWTFSLNHVEESEETKQEWEGEKDTLKSQKLRQMNLKKKINGLFKIKMFFLFKCYVLKHHRHHHYHHCCCRWVLLSSSLLSVVQNHFFFFFFFLSCVLFCFLFFCFLEFTVYEMNYFKFWKSDDIV